MAENQFVIFRLGNEKYGVDIMKVKEICEYKASTKVPNAPDFIEGIINLRGEIIPIVNLKKRFKISGADEVSTYSRIIVININEKNVGFIVDEASEVLRINGADIEEAPEIITGIDRRFITGVGKVNESIILILDLEKILTEKEKEKLEELK